MDFDANLEASCPVEIVEQARSEDLTQPLFGAGALSAAWASNGAGPGACFNAVVLYLLPSIGPDTNVQQLQSWLGYAADYVGTPQPVVLQYMREAALRLPYDPDYAEAFFRFLIAHRIDIRSELSPRIVPDWTFGKIKTPSAHTWYYFRYLAVMGDDDAYARLAEKVAATADANWVAAQLDSLSELRTPQARAILEQYRDDPRNTISAGGRPFPLKDSVAVMIDLGDWTE